MREPARVLGEDLGVHLEMICTIIPSPTCTFF